MGVFRASVSWWVLTGVWMTASLLKSPGLFSVFWSILIMLLFEWFPHVFLFPGPPIPIPILWWLYRAHQLQLVSPSPSCSIVFQFSSKVLVLIYLFAFFQLYSAVSRNGKVRYSTGSLFLLTITKPGRLAEISWFVCISELLLLFNFQFLIIFTRLLAKRSRVRESSDYMYSMYLCYCLLGDIFQSNWSYSLKEITSSAKCHFFVFHIVWES